MRPSLSGKSHPETSHHSPCHVSPAITALSLFLPYTLPVSMTPLCRGSAHTGLVATPWLGCQTFPPYQYSTGLTADPCSAFMTAPGGGPPRPPQSAGIQRQHASPLERTEGKPQEEKKRKKREKSPEPVRRRVTLRLW